MIWALLACSHSELRYVGGGAVTIELWAKDEGGLEGTLELPGLASDDFLRFWEQRSDLGPQQLCELYPSGAGLRERRSYQNGPLTEPGLHSRDFHLNGCAPVSTLSPQDCLGELPVFVQLAGTFLKEDERFTGVVNANLDLSIRDETGDYELLASGTAVEDPGEAMEAGALEFDASVVASPPDAFDCRGASRIRVDWAFDPDDVIVVLID